MGFYYGVLATIGGVVLTLTKGATLNDVCAAIFIAAGMICLTIHFESKK